MGNTLLNVRDKPCSSCKGVARTAVILIDSVALQTRQSPDGHYLCENCFERVRNSIEQEQGVLHLDDVVWNDE